MSSRVEMSSQQKEDQHACRVTRKKVHARKMLGTSRTAVFFQWFVVPAVRKVGSLKRRVRRWLFRRQAKNGTPLWQKAHLEVKMLKNWQCRSTFWSSDVQKWHAAVAKSTFGSENAWRCRSTFWSSDVQKWHAAVERSTFASENAKKLTVSEPFWTLRC